ncbi:MAG: DUF479 domain-containing protein [Saprospiraceae bacterium]|nr:DUF479 domain-containing protein [Saprospiraceae bacterium]
MGNYLADFLRPAEWADLPESVMDGVRFHREIDRYTDSHPAVRESKRRIRSASGKYASVVIDVFYDFLLTAEWSHFVAITLEDFEVAVYQMLGDHLHLAPESHRQRLRTMIEHRWLGGYRSRADLGRVFHRMAHRVSRPEFFEPAIEALHEQKDAYRMDFRRFFPELLSHMAVAFPAPNPWLHHA